MNNWSQFDKSVHPEDWLESVDTNIVRLDCLLRLANFEFIYSKAVYPGVF